MSKTTTITTTSFPHPHQQITPSQHFNRNHLFYPNNNNTMFDDDDDDDQNESDLSLNNNFQHHDDESDSVELMQHQQKPTAASTTKTDENDDDGEFVNEPTSATAIIISVAQQHQQEEGVNAPNEQNDDEQEEIKDEVTDISSIIPPDSVTVFGGCEMQINFIWYSTLIISTLLGIILGVLFSPSCLEFYSKKLLIHEEKDQHMLSDIIQVTSQLSPSTTKSPSSTPLRSVNAPPSPTFAQCFAAVLSSCIGNCYAMYWTLSFIPGLFVNYQRQSVVGQSIAFVYANTLGFTAYAIFNLSIYFSETIKREYQHRFHSKDNVEFNDVYFSIFASFCCYVNTYQCLFYERGGQKVHAAWKFFVGGCVVIAIFWLCLIGLFYHRNETPNENDGVPVPLLNPLDFIYGLGVIKLLVTLFKYAPQVYLNYQRKKTVGLAISVFIFDFLGGSLSLFQELLDAGLKDSWIALEGNLVKLALSVISIGYDSIFLVQHYCVYAKRNAGLIAENKRKMRIRRIRELVSEVAA